jgi:hypothetical protein
MKKYNLIIQGPILSVGMTGESYLKYTAEKTADHIVRFNCIANIQNILQRYAHFFNEIVVSTWESETISASDISFCSNCTLIKSKDITGVYKNKKHPNGQIGLIKQFYSLRQGISALTSKEEECFIVKIRTDQFVNLELLIKEHENKTTEEKEKKICISYFGLNSVADFYFIATQKVMLTFCEAIMDIRNIPQINISKTSVHIVIPYAYYIKITGVNPKNEYSIFLKSIYPTFERLNTQLINCLTAKELGLFIDKHFTPLSSELLYSSTWRGTGISKNDFFSFKLNTDYSALCPKLNAFNMFIFLSPKVYFTQKGNITVRAIIGIINFFLLNVIPFYKKIALNKYSIR